uniref:Uncharacterized protein n=1 Tax=Strigamia maritima TaxID=126957 RepID=T1JII9_STRMM
MKATTQLALQILGLCFFISTLVEPLQRCQQWNGRRQRNIWGDYLLEPTCLGPNGEKYPKDKVNRLVSQLPGYPFRNGRTLSDPIQVQEKLLQSYKKFNGLDRNWRMVRSALDSCNNITTARLCQTEFNTTVPMYGISMTSGEPVTIVQKFPNLLQQIVYEEC